MTQFISEEEAIARLQDPSNLSNMFGTPVVDNPEPTESLDETPEQSFAERAVDRIGKPIRRRLLPFERAVIGISAHTNSQAEVAAAFGVHPVTVARLKVGQNTHSKVEDPKLKKVIDINVSKINDVAVDRLLKTMGAISDQKIGEIKTAREASEVAKNLATIIEKTSPKEKGGNASAQVIIMSPQPATMQDYKTIEAPIPND